MRSAVALLLLLAGCAHRQTPRYETIVSFDCSETAETRDGQLSAVRNGVGWTRDLGDGMRWGFSLSFIGEQEEAAFATKGFHGDPFGHPIIFVDFADRFKSLGELNYGGKRPSWRVGSEFRIGDRTKRAWVPINMVAVLFWSELEQMLADQGDLTVTLYNVDGTIYQRAAVPRAAFARVEQALKTMHARVMEKERDRERLCIRHEVVQPVGEDIIIA